MPVFQHLPRSFGFGSVESLPIVRRPEEPPEPMLDGVCYTMEQTSDAATADICEQLLPVDNSCAQPEIEIAVHPDREEGVAEKEGEGVTMPADLETPRLCEVSDTEPEHITHAGTVLEAEPHDISALRKLGAAVLVRAFEDAQTDSRARQWFEVTPQPMLTFWCEVAGLDCEGFRKQARKMMAATT
jgi:hypothetical protein